MGRLPRALPAAWVLLLVVAKRHEQVLGALAGPAAVAAAEMPEEEMRHRRAAALAAAGGRCCLLVHQPQVLPLQVPGWSRHHHRRDQQQLLLLLQPAAQVPGWGLPLPLPLQPAMQVPGWGLHRCLQGPLLQELVLLQLHLVAWQLPPCEQPAAGGAWAPAAAPACHMGHLAQTDHAGQAY